MLQRLPLPIRRDRKVVEARKSKNVSIRYCRPHQVDGGGTHTHTHRLHHEDIAHVQLLEGVELKEKRVKMSRKWEGLSSRAVLFVIGHLSNCPIVHLSESGR